MRISFKNIGMLKEADIELNGLTIIAGENDTGKSTIGKSIFAIIKAFNRQDQLLKPKETLINECFDELMQKFRNVLTSELNDQIQNNLKILQKDLLSSSYLFTDTIQTQLEHINKLISTHHNRLFKGSIQRSLELLEVFLNIDDTTLSTLKRAIKSAFSSEFDVDLKSKFNENPPVIKCTNENNFSWILNLLTEELIMDNEDDVYLPKEVIYIENPILLQLFKNLDSISSINEFLTNKTIRKKGIATAPLHIVDFIEQLKICREFASYDLENLDLFDSNNIGLNLNKISNIIAGTINYNEDRNEFNYNKSGKIIKIMNTASGIKTFGIIQLLIQSNQINENTMLIVDEPENHLHPKWQILYAELIIELVKNNVKVLINSHSPYLIQALKAFSDEQELDEYSNFYFAKKLDEYTSVVEKNNELDQIVKALYAPFGYLQWKKQQSHNT